VTPLCVFRFDPARHVLVVEALHPGVTRDELQRHTGFVLEYDAAARVTPAPTQAELGLLRSRVRDAVARVYPEYAGSALGR
jgi:glutaconate CoA-transferase subunit B